VATDRLGPLRGRSIAVFGSSEPAPGSPPYERAHRLGARIASAGAIVVTGGYGGVMEAASRGAREAGGEAIGITGDFFADRRPNRWLTETVPTGNLFERTRLLIDRSDAFIILPGKSGTIAELAFLWALHRAGKLGDKPVVLCGAVWPPLLDALDRAGAIEPAQRQMNLLLDDVDGALELIASRLAGPSSERSADSSRG
jgi:uncharacterized protein (TIGR00725 family)